MAVEPHDGDLGVRRDPYDVEGFAVLDLEDVSLVVDVEDRIAVGLECSHDLVKAGVSWILQSYTSFDLSQIRFLATALADSVFLVVTARKIE